MRKLSFFLLSLFLLFCGGKSRPAAAVLTKAGTDAGEIWLATYLAKTKIGYGLIKYRRLNQGFRFDYINRMTLSMMGKKQYVNASSRIMSNPDLSLRSFEFELGSQDGVFKAKGRVEGERLMITTDHGNRIIRLTGKLYPAEIIGRLVTESNPVPGKRMNYLTFDGAVLDTLTTEVEVLGRETVELDREKLPALKLKVKRAKIDMIVWVDDVGMTLKEESPLGVHSLRVSHEQALSGEPGSPLDILKVLAVPVDTVIPQGKRYRRFQVAVSGIDTAVFKIGGGVQQIVGGSGDEIRLEVRIPQPAKGVRLPIPDHPEFLKPTITIQSEAAEIVKVAREIVDKTDDAAVASEKIVKWVFHTLKKETVASLPSAIEVLRNKKGDCNEHSILVAALARAIGIPTKVVVGLVYLDGAFYYHAWNEVYVGNWVPVDATFGEFPADALRLKLAEGELSQQAEVLGVVNKIAIRVLEFD